MAKDAVPAARMVVSKLIDWGAEGLWQQLVINAVSSLLGGAAMTALLTILKQNWMIAGCAGVLTCLLLYVALSWVISRRQLRRSIDFANAGFETLSDGMGILARKVEALAEQSVRDGTTETQSVAAGGINAITAAGAKARIDGIAFIESLSVYLDLKGSSEQYRFVCAVVVSRLMWKLAMAPLLDAGFRFDSTSGYAAASSSWAMTSTIFS